MKVKNEELVELLKEQVVIEREQSEALDKSIKESKNTVIKHLLNIIRLDTLRHMDLCEGIIDLLSGTAITEPEKEFVMNRMADHMKSEEEMLERIKKAIKKTEEPVIRALLRQLASDEYRHHKLLEAITVKKTYTTLDVWDTLSLMGPYDYLLEYPLEGFYY